MLDINIKMYFTFHVVLDDYYNSNLKEKNVMWKIPIKHFHFE